MGIFNVSLRSARRDSVGDTRTPNQKPRHGLRSFLASGKNHSSEARRRNSVGGGEPLRSSKSLTVLVDQINTSIPAVPSGPCRFVATATKLGSGAYGAVVLGRDLCTQSEVAIKFIPDGRMRPSSLEREVSMLQRLSDANHPALVRFHGHVKPANVRAGEIRTEGTLPITKPAKECHALVMECVHGGELFDYVVKREGLKEAEAAPLFAQLCDAVHAAHGLGIAHRDLKLENVLLVRKKNAPPKEGGGAGSAIKLIDWGLAHQHAVDHTGQPYAEMLRSRCGSRSYMAPEVTNRDISGTVGYDGFAADVWSLGVCLFAIHLAFFPFEQAHPEHDWRARRVLEAQKLGKSTMRTILSFYPQKAANGGLSDGLLNLLDRMLVFNPRKRASLAEVLCSEWLAPHVAAACPHASIPRGLSIAHLATRSGRSISVSSDITSEGSLTPRSLDEPPTYAACGASVSGARHSRASSRDASFRLSVERADSSGTTNTASSLASSGAAFGAALGAAHGVSGHRAAIAVAAALPRAAARDARLPLPPARPDPLKEAVQMVVAGAAGGHIGAAPFYGANYSAAQQYAGKQGRPSELERPDPLDLATMLSKTCKMNNLSSPRRPEGHPEHRSVIL